MLTNKGKYGLKALVHLGRLPTGTTALAADIASANRIPKKFLDAILLDLRNAGLLHARKGPGGGYALARPPTAINIGDAVRVLDGPLAPIACASRTAYRRCEDCVNVDTCAIRLSMLKVRDAISDVLDHTTLADVLAEQSALASSFTYEI